MNFKNSYLSYVMMYVFYYMSLALFSGLIAVYLKGKGLSSIDIAFIVAAGPLMLLIAQPIIGYLNDFFNGKRLNMLFLACTSMGAILFLHMHHVYELALTYGFIYAIAFGVNPAIESMAITSPFRYGTIRMWGTIGYAIGIQVAGLVYYFIHPDVVYLVYALAVLLCLVGFAAIEMPKQTKATKQGTPQSLLKLFAYKPFIIYLIMIFMFYGTLSVSGTYIPNLLIKNGVHVNVATTIVSFAVLVELPLVTFSHLFMDKLKSKYLLGGILFLEILQFSIYAFIPIVGAKIVATLLFKHTLGMTFTMTNLKIVKNLMPPTIQVSALAFVSTVGSISTILLQQVTGYTIEMYSYEASYMVLIGCVGVAMLLLTCFKITDKKDLILFN